MGVLSMRTWEEAATVTTKISVSCLNLGLYLDLMAYHLRSFSGYREGWFVYIKDNTAS